MAWAPSGLVRGSLALAGRGISLLHWWVAWPAAARSRRVMPIMGPGPNRLCTRWPERKPMRTSGSITAKWRASLSATALARAEWPVRRRRLMRAPVSMETGQAVAHRPSAAQVSTAM